MTSSSSYMQQHASGGSNAQGRAINKMLLEILRDRVIDPIRLDLAIESYCDRMDCVNLATLLFHTGKKRMILLPCYISRIAKRFTSVKEELRSREASNAIYGLKAMSSELPEVRELVHALASKIYASHSQFVAQGVGNALYGLQMMTSEHEEVRYLLSVLSTKVAQCIELLEAQNIGNAMYGLRGMNSDYKEVRSIIIALTPKIATAREDLNGQALGNSLYGLQSMNSKESEVRLLLAVLATKVSHTWEDLKAQEIGNALYGLKRMSSDVPEVRILVASLVTKIGKSPEVLDAQAIGNSLYGLQNMRSNHPEVLSLLTILAEKLTLSFSELDGQAMSNSMFGLQGMSSEYPEVRAVINALSTKISTSCLDLNAQELGNCMYGLQSMTCEYSEVRYLMTVLLQKLQSCKQELSSQEIGNAVFGLQGMCSSYSETRVLTRHIAVKVQQSHAILEPHCIAMCLFGLQRLSSECEDVRLLVLALSTKIEHSWKLLSAQNLSSGIYGLHSLSSSEVEVRCLVKALVAKVMSCRDELTAKQIGYLFLGLQHMSSEHTEVLALISALTEKIAKSTYQWTLTTLSMVLFGAQGMSSSHDEVGLLLQAIAAKALDLLPSSPLSDKTGIGTVKDNGHLLANCFFGLQRMDTDNASVCIILNVLFYRLTSLCATSSNGAAVVDARMCASIAYGVQNCSCTFEVVKGIMSLIADLVQQIASSFLLDLPHRHNSKGLPLCDSSISNILLHYPDLAIDRSECKLVDLLTLFQYFSLSLFALRDLDFDRELQRRLDSALVSLRQAVDMHELELVSQQLTHPERRMAKEVSALLSKDPFVVSTGVFVRGFFITVLIQPSKVPMKAAFQAASAGAGVVSTDLSIEVKGSSYSFPCKELFYRLRRSYLEALGVGGGRGGAVLKVEYVPVESFRQDNHHGMKIHSAVLLPLYSMEGAAESLSLTYNKSLLGCDSASFSLSSSSDSFIHSAATQSNSRDAAVATVVATTGPQEQWVDDDYAVNDMLRANGLQKRQIRLQQQRQTSSSSSYTPKLPLGMTLSWQGTWPLFDKTLFFVTNSVASNHHHHHHLASSYIVPVSPSQGMSLNMDRIISSGPSMRRGSSSSIDSITSDSILIGSSSSSSSPLNSSRLLFNGGGDLNLSTNSRLPIHTLSRTQQAEEDVRLQLNCYRMVEDSVIDSSGGGSGSGKDSLLTSRSLDTMMIGGHVVAAEAVRRPSIRSVEAFDSNSIISRTSINTTDINSVVSASIKLGGSTATSYPLSPSSGKQHLHTIAAASSSSPLSSSSYLSSDIDFGLDLRPGSQQFNLSPCSLSSSTGDKDEDEIDDELAALEAQLEVARLEAKIKALKAKKKQQAK